MIHLLALWISSSCQWVHCSCGVFCFEVNEIILWRASCFFSLSLVSFAFHQFYQLSQERVELPTPCWLRIQPSAEAFRSAKTAPTTHTADSNETSVMVELPRAQLASLRPTTASPPWLSPKNTTILVLLQSDQYFVAKTNGSKAPSSWTPPLFAIAPSPVRKIAHVWHANKTKKCRSTRVATLWWQRRQDWLEFFERRTKICRIARTILCLLRQEDRGGGASNGAECTWCGGQWKTQTTVDNRNNALDTSKGVRGQHEHGTMMDGTWCLGLRRGKRMSQGGKGGGEGGIQDCSHTQG